MSVIGKAAAHVQIIRLLNYIALNCSKIIKTQALNCSKIIKTRAVFHVQFSSCGYEKFFWGKARTMDV